MVNPDEVTEMIEAAAQVVRIVDQANEGKPLTTGEHQGAALRILDATMVQALDRFAAQDPETAERIQTRWPTLREH